MTAAIAFKHCDCFRIYLRNIYNEALLACAKKSAKSINSFAIIYVTHQIIMIHMSEMSEYEYLYRGHI